MKKQKLKKWLPIAAVLCMAVGCQKEQPPPTWAALCGLPNKKFTYKMTFENTRADIGLAGEFIVEGLLSEYKEDEGQSSAFLCPEQENEFVNWVSYDYRTNKPQPYRYRVWGEVYNCDGCTTIVAFRNVYYIKLTKLEYQN